VNSYEESIVKERYSINKIAKFVKALINAKEYNRASSVFSYYALWFNKSQLLEIYENLNRIRDYKTYNIDYKVLSIKYNNILYPTYDITEKCVLIVHKPIKKFIHPLKTVGTRYYDNLQIKINNIDRYTVIKSLQYPEVIIEFGDLLNAGENVSYEIDYSIHDFNAKMIFSFWTTIYCSNNYIVHLYADSEYYFYDFKPQPIKINSDEYYWKDNNFHNLKKDLSLNDIDHLKNIHSDHTIFFKSISKDYEWNDMLSIAFLCLLPMLLNISFIHISYKGSFIFAKILLVLSTCFIFLNIIYANSQPEFIYIILDYIIDNISNGFAILLTFQIAIMYSLTSITRHITLASNYKKIYILSNIIIVDILSALFYGRWVYGLLSLHGIYDSAVLVYTILYVILLFIVYMQLKNYVKSINLSFIWIIGIIIGAYISLKSILIALICSMLNIIYIMNLKEKSIIYNKSYKKISIKQRIYNTIGSLKKTRMLDYVYYISTIMTTIYTIINLLGILKNK